MALKNTDTGDLASQVKSIQEELLGLTDSIRAFTSERVASGAESLRGAADVASDTLRSTAEEARRRGSRVAEDLESHITDNPLPAVLIAAGLGLVIGAVLSRK